MNKLNVSRIVSEHFATLTDARTGLLSWGDVFEFFGLPALIAGAAIWFGVRFNYNVLSAILTAFSIFAGLLLNLLMLVFSFAEKAQNGGILADTRRKLLRELHSNVSFSILVSVIVVIVAVVAVVRVNPTPSETRLTGATMTSLLTYLMSNFLMTVLMILKRMHVLLTQSIKDVGFRHVA